MLHAVHTPPLTRMIEVPANLDDVDGLLTLRAELEEAIVGGDGDIHLDCAELAGLSSPVVGWFVELAGVLARDDRALVFDGASAELCLRFRTLGTELRGLRFDRSR